MIITKFIYAMVNLGNLTESKLIQNLVPVHKCGLVENIVQKGGHKMAIKSSVIPSENDT